MRIVWKLVFMMFSETKRSLKLRFTPTLFTSYYDRKEGTMIDLNISQS